MIAGMRRAQIAAALLAASCLLEAPPGAELDVRERCREIGLVVADPEVLTGWTIHGAAAVDSGAAWYLARDPSAQLWLRRVPTDIPAIELSALGDPDDFDLKAGPVAGQTWLALDREVGARVWRIDEDAAEALAGPALAFPGLEGAWTRRLIFISDAPHLLALPRVTKIGEVAVHVAALTPELEIGASWELTATVTCAPFSELSCPLYREDLRDLEVLDTAEPGGIAGAAALLSVTARPEPDAGPDPGAPSAVETSVISLVIQRDVSGEGLVLTRRDHVTWLSDGAVLVAPGAIAADLFGLYVIAGLVPGPETSAGEATSSDYLFRADLLGAGTGDPGEVIGLLPKTLASHLLALGGRVVLGQVVGETWHVAPIEGDAVLQDTLGSLRVGSGASIVRAGRDQAIVVGERPNTRVRARCDDVE